MPVRKNKVQAKTEQSPITTIPAMEIILKIEKGFSENEYLLNHSQP